MREILFRGKQVDNGEWVYGLLTIMWGQYHIIDLDDENTAYPVEPATVGQYTGLQDKNGMKIFEGDIISAPYWNGRKVEMMKGLIEFSKGAFSVVWKYTMYGKHFAGYVADMVVIGNIFDNPDLREENNG